MARESTVPVGSIDHLVQDDCTDIRITFETHRQAVGEILFGEQGLYEEVVYVIIAEVADIPETDTWTPFEMTFTYSTDIDMDELERQGYSLTIVFTSSTQGAYYEGAPGSTLYIDNVRLECEEEK